MILDHEQLQHLTALKRRDAIERVLKDKGIRYHKTNGRLWTTLDEVHEALGKTRKRQHGPNFDALTAQRPREERVVALRIPGRR